MTRAGQGLRRLWRWLAGAVAALALLAALGVGAFRFAIELLPGYQQQIADQVRAATGLRLEFDALNARSSAVRGCCRQAVTSRWSAPSQAV
jgi:uncharacterized protein YhdP